MTLNYYANSPDFLVNAFFSGTSNPLFVSYDESLDGQVVLENATTNYSVTVVTASPNSLESYFHFGTPVDASAEILAMFVRDASDNIVAHLDYNGPTALNAASFIHTLETVDATGNLSLLSDIAQHPLTPYQQQVFSAADMPESSGPYTFFMTFLPEYLWHDTYQITGSAFDDYMHPTGSSSQVQLLHGGAGNDTMISYNSASLYYGDSGDDTFEARGTTGASFDGGTGTDMADYARAVDDFTVAVTGGGAAQVTRSGLTDTISNTEYLLFHRSASGETFSTLYDLAGQHDWFSVTQTTNASDEQTALSLEFANGRTVTYQFDGTTRTGRTTSDNNDNYGWTSITDTLDLLGRITQRSTLLDSGLTANTAYAPDGSSTRTTLDAADDFVWASVASTYDNTGTLTSHIVTFDNGIERNSAYTAGQLSTITITDGNDNHGWDRVVDTYNSAGFNTARDVYLDDGSTTHFEYLPLG